MKKMNKILAVVLGVFFVFFFSVRVSADEFYELKGKHFIVYYMSISDEQIARNVLNKAEKYYKRIGSLIGYTRYSNFWTWNERAKIIIFPDKRTFMRRTGQPAWSLGYADRDKHLFDTKSIVTYKQEYNFEAGLLPHEISHLIIYDFLSGLKSVPIWLDEGISQLNEKDKADIAYQMMRILVSKRQWIAFDFLNRWDIRTEKDSNKAKIFYAQSLSIVDFMIKQYGKDAFRKFLRNLRDGKSVEESLSNAYSQKIKNLSDLEKRWVQYISR